MLTMDAVKAGHVADDIIASEIAKQDAMWGRSPERTDSMAGELALAAGAQLDALILRRGDCPGAFDVTPAKFPATWSGFRDYGSDVANLAVVAAYIRQEMKRLIARGAPTNRTSRKLQEPYTKDQPAVQL